MKSNINLFKTFGSDRWELEQVVAALNGQKAHLLSAEDRTVLLAFVELWNESSRDTRMKPFADVIAEGRRFSLDNLAKCWTLALLQRRDGANWLHYPSENCEDNAALFASMLLTNPLRLKLSDGPCQRPACQRWFIKKRPLQKTCDRRCLGIVRTVAATKEQRQHEHKKSLTNARRALRSYRQKDGDWKSYVSRKTGLTANFLTHAVNKGELKPPKGAVAKRRK